MAFDGRLRFYPTLRCNLACCYCVNRHWPEGYAGASYEELEPDGWIAILKRENRNVIITGGEPFLYPELLELVNAIPLSLTVLIYTNLTVLPKGFPGHLNRPVRLRVTYHPSCKIAPSDFADRIRSLAQHSKLSGSVHLIDSRKARAQTEAARPWFTDLPWKLTVERDQYDQFPERSGRKITRRVRCTRRSILVAPNGVRYPCVSCLLSNRLAREDLTKEPLRYESVEVVCNHWGYCAPCDGLTEGEPEFLD